MNKLREDVFRRTREVIAKQFDDGFVLAEITYDTDIIDDLGADELDTVEIVMNLEEEFGVEIAGEIAVKLRTPRFIVDYILFT